MATTTNQYVKKINNYLIRDEEAHSKISTLDSNVVKLSGDQTIYGNKTFKGENTFDNRFTIKDDISMQNTAGTKTVTFTQDPNGQTGTYSLKVPMKNGTLTTAEDVASSIKTNVTDKLGVENGIATLDENGKVPSRQLPSYVDDVIEGYYDSRKPEEGGTGYFYDTNSFTADHVMDGKAGKIYVDLATGKTYRWGTSTYVEISASLAIGTTEGTAYSGVDGAALAEKVNGTISQYTNPETGEKIWQVNQAALALSAKSATTAGTAAVAEKLDNTITFDMGDKGNFVFDGTTSMEIGTSSNPINYAIEAASAVKASQDSAGKSISGTYAKKESPTFTGTPTAPTATAGTKTTQIATTAFVGTAVNNMAVTLNNGLVSGSVDLSAYGFATKSELAAQSISIDVNDAGEMTISIGTSA